MSISIFGMFGLRNGGLLTNKAYAAGASAGSSPTNTGGSTSGGSTNYCNTNYPFPPSGVANPANALAAAEALACQDGAGFAANSSPTTACTSNQWEYDTGIAGNGTPASSDDPTILKACTAGYNSNKQQVPAGCTQFSGANDIGDILGGCVAGEGLATSGGNSGSCNQTTSVAGEGDYTTGCTDGYTYIVNDPTPSSAAVTICTDLPLNSETDALHYCEMGYDGAVASDNQAEVCYSQADSGGDCNTGYAMPDVESNDCPASKYPGTQQVACAVGYEAFKLGGTDSVCSKFTGADNTACEAGFTSSGGTPGSSGGTADPCEASGGPLSWLMCGIIETVNSAENGLMTGVVQPLLQTKPLAFNADCSKAGSNCTSNDELGSLMYSVWSNFRVYGDVLLVIALLVIVFGEAIGGGLIDAYTAKKILPRILIAAILINLSIYIVAALEDIINVIGGGLDSLIRLPFENVANPQSAMYLHGLSQAHVSGGVGVMGAVLFAIVAYGIFTGVAVPFLLFAVGALLLATLGVLVTLAIRQGLIIFLVLISPLAFALYCLPNTEQYFKKWWSLLVKTLLVYPIVMVVFAMSFVLGVVMTNFGVHPQMLADIMSLIAMVAPLFMIPFAFKMSGGIIGSVQGMVTSLKSRATKPMMGMAKQKSMEKWQNAKLENRFKGGNDTNLRGRFNRAIAKSTQLGTIGYNPKNWKGNLAVSHDAITAQEVARNMKENAVYATFANDDSLNRAAAESNNATELRDNLLKADSEKPPEKRRYKLGASDPALNEDIRRVERVRRSMSAESFKQMTTQQALAGGTAFETTGDAWNLVRKATRGNDAARRRLVGAGRQILMGAGQGAQGGAAWSTVYNQLGEMDRLEVGKPGGLTPKDLEHVSEVIEDSAAESLAPGQQVYNQKPDSAEKLAKAHARRAKTRIAKYIDIAGQKPTTPEEVEQKAADLSLARRDVEYAFGTAMGIHDAQNQAAPQIAEKFATGLNAVDLITPEQIAALPESIKPGVEGSLLTDMLVQSRNFDGTMPTIKLDDTTGQLAAYVTRAVRDAEGKIAKDEDGNIVTRIEVEPITVNTLQIEERLRDRSENVAQVRRDIGSRASAEAQRLMGGGVIPGASGAGEFVPPGGGPAGPTPATPTGP